MWPHLPARQRILMALELAGQRGLRGPEIGKMCALWSGTLYSALMKLEVEGRITSEWDGIAYPRSRRYTLKQ
jgi:DNA-binding PadR family transcriptional regulator